ncbi:MAG: CcdB family protein [Halioglobus sp.]|nr:CcdB family protein [Halioglobus sp.]
MEASFDQQAPKKPTNLSLNTDLLKKCRALNINLSVTLEQALNDKLAETAAHKFDNEKLDKLTPMIEYAGEKLLVLTPQVATVPAQLLKKPAGSLQQFRDEIIAAMDFAVTGL